MRDVRMFSKFETLLLSCLYRYPLGHKNKDRERSYLDFELTE